MILAIEGAMRGGSLALIDGSEAIAKWHSPAAVSRSEELLGQIALLIENSGVGKADITKIAVSRGPGSYTGIRIALATAMGLARALDVPCVGVSLLKAIVLDFELKADFAAIVPIGRDGFAWTFAGPNGAIVKAASGKLPNFLEQIRESSTEKIIAHSDAHLPLLTAEGGTRRSLDLIDIGRDMAVSVGLASQVFDDGLEPLYAATDKLIQSPGEPVG